MIIIIIIIIILIEENLTRLIHHALKKKKTWLHFYYRLIKPIRGSYLCSLSFFCFVLFL